MIHTYKYSTTRAIPNTSSSLRNRTQFLNTMPDVEQLWSVGKTLATKHNYLVALYLVPWSLGTRLLFGTSLVLVSCILEVQFLFAGHLLSEF